MMGALFTDCRPCRSCVLATVAWSQLPPMIAQKPSSQSSRDSTEQASPGCSAARLRPGNFKKRCITAEIRPASRQESSRIAETFEGAGYLGGAAPRHIVQQRISASLDAGI